MESRHGGTDGRARGKPSALPGVSAAPLPVLPPQRELPRGFTLLLCHRLPSGALLAVHTLQVGTVMICWLETRGCISGTASPSAGSSQLLCLGLRCPFPFLRLL